MTKSIEGGHTDGHIHVMASLHVMRPCSHPTRLLLYTGLNKFPPEALFNEVLLDPNSPLKDYMAVKYFYAESGLPPLRVDFITGRRMNR